MSGGTRSAFGDLYQYAATAEYYLRFLSEHPTAALLVEPTALASRGVAADDDIVDFAVELDSLIVDKVQVKGSGDPQSHQLYPGEAREVLDRLSGCTTSTATRLTNRPLSSGLTKQRGRLEDADGMVATFAHPAPRSADGSPTRRILVDSRNIDDPGSGCAGGAHPRAPRRSRPQPRRIQRAHRRYRPAEPELPIRCRHGRLL